MNWQRIGLLLRFDLYYCLTRLRGWIFLVPFSFFWFLIFKQIDNGVNEMLQSQEGIMITSALYGTDGALSLFIDNPPSVSLFYVISLSIIPFFMVLASYDQFSTDLSSGYFQFLSSRCKRMEIFLARILSAFSLVAGAFFIATVICVIFSIRNDGSPTIDIAFYSLQIYFTLLLYALPFITYMSLISSIVSSPLAALFLGVFGYALIWILNLFTFFIEYKGIFSHLLANNVKSSLIEMYTEDFYFALAILPIYVLVYAGMAFANFNRRNL